MICSKPIHLPIRYEYSDCGIRNRVYADRPCGKCLECLHNKQSDRAILSVEEFKKFPTMFFLTLTYNSNNLPVSYVDVFIDEDTGEIIKTSTKHKKGNRTQGNPVFASKAKAKQLQFKGNYCKTETLPNGWTRVYYPSLRREDVKTWLKNCREKWYKMTGERMNFTYSGAGEYGSQTFRPHYHFNFFGLTPEQMRYMCKEWTKTKGFIWCDQIEKTNTNSQMATALYVSKYIYKSPSLFSQVLEDEVFDEPFSEKLNEFHIEKPRVMTSKQFGISQDFEKIKAEMLDGAELSDDSEETALRLINKNVKYHFNGKDYRIPKKIADRVYKIDGKNSPLRNKIVAIMDDRYIADFIAQSRAFEAQYVEGKSGICAGEAFLKKQQEDLQVRKNSAFKYIQDKYRKAKLQ